MNFMHSRKYINIPATALTLPHSWSLQYTETTLLFFLVTPLPFTSTNMTSFFSQINIFLFQRSKSQTSPFCSTLTRGTPFNFCTVAWLKAIARNLDSKAQLVCTHQLPLSQPGCAVCTRLTNDELHITTIKSTNESLSKESHRLFDVFN